MKMLASCRRLVLTFRKYVNLLGMDFIERRITWWLSQIGDTKRVNFCIGDDWTVTITKKVEIPMLLQP
jgi:hypothetical protein